MPRYEALHNMSPQSEFYSEEKMAALYPGDFRLRAETSRCLREYGMRIAEQRRTDGDPRNPESVLEFFLFKRYDLLV